MLLLSCAFRSAIGQKSAEANRSRFVEIAITTKVNFLGTIGIFSGGIDGELRVRYGSPKGRYYDGVGFDGTLRHGLVEQLKPEAWPIVPINDRTASEIERYNLTVPEMSAALAPRCPSVDADMKRATVDRARPFRR
jgi:hypothetical protein